MTSSEATTYTNEQVWDGLTERYGAGWDDETDLRTRYGVDVDVDAPRVERIRKHTSPRPHVPGEHWANSSCLCSCHFVRTESCDDRECQAWRVQNARKAAREQERKQARWQRKQNA